jgi:phosphoadenosine phosphosulfate reductase
VRGLTDARSEGAAEALSPGSGDGGEALSTAAPGRDARLEGLTETLREALERHGERLVLLCSFQKEESVLVDELLRIGGGKIEARIATIDTGVLFPETLETWRAFEERFDVTIEVHDARGSDGPWTGPEHCCSQAKVAALEHILKDAEGWVTGIRREQGPTRAESELVERDERRGLWKYNPLAHWTEKDLWRRIHERNLPYNPLHDRGYASIGCAPCTLPGDGREGRWAGTEKTECGLHVDDLPAVARETDAANAADGASVRRAA